MTPNPVTAQDIIATYGLDGVVFFPRAVHEKSEIGAQAAAFLANVGIPTDSVFLARNGSTDPSEDSVHVGAWAAEMDVPVPEKYRSWLVLGYFPYATAAFNPEDGRVYSFADDGEGEPVLIHESLDSLVRALIVLKEFMKDRAVDPDLSPERIRVSIETFDRNPFADEDSAWSQIYEEMSDGIF
ncbi:SUKH-4 family immunity protein [Streptomyces sp. NBC_00467]|uniref:SUKH-4 family immunity protein n=1 Tax=Streptomyces sp. NBC_00467 TaxID=2975752 RepID=UPI002E17061A